MIRGEYNWIIGAGLGFALGGPIGGVIGAILGSQASRIMGQGRGAPFRERVGSDHREHYTGGLEGDLIVSFLVLSAAVTRADEQIRSAEVRLLKEYLIRSFGVTRAAALMKMFKEILEKPFDVDEVCAQLLEEAEPAFRRIVMQVLVEIAWSDTELASAEQEILARIARGLGFSETEFRSMNAQSNVAAPHRDYEILELTSGASDEDVRMRYRELVKKYHPDKVSHLGPEFKELAERKFKEVAGAYERIKKAKGF